MTNDKAQEPTPEQPQPTAILAQVGTMPDGQLQVAFAQEIDNKLGFMLACARMFIDLAAEVSRAEQSRKAKAQAQILRVPPGTMVQ